MGYFAELRLVIRDRSAGRRHGGRKRVLFSAKFGLSVSEVALFEERAVSLVGVMPAEAGLIIVLFFAHRLNIINYQWYWVRLEECRRKGRLFGRLWGLREEKRV